MTSYKKGVISYSESINIGDDIQSLAILKIIGKPDYFLDRDHLNKPKTKEKIKLICNGWFMMKPENWPPAENIKPLFISFHITHSNNSQDILLNNKNLEYLKLHEPIGCRDFDTEKILLEKGIKAYYSGCATLTFKNKYKERNNNIICVDPFYNLGPDLQKRYLDLLIPKSEKENTVFINQDRNQKISNVEERFKEAEELIEIYSKAKLVITSRIHCALPCLALGTPVYFVDVGFDTKNTRNRFKGITDNMRIIDGSHFPYTSFIRKDRLLRKLNIDKLLFRNKNSLINWKNPEQNPHKISTISDNLIQRINSFLKE